MIVCPFQVELLKDLFSWIYEDKFSKRKATEYLSKAGWNTISICLKYFTEREPQNDRLPEVIIPNQESPFDEKLLYVLVKLDNHFESGIFLNNRTILETSYLES